MPMLPLDHRFILGRTRFGFRGHCREQWVMLAGGALRRW